MSGCDGAGGDRIACIAATRVRDGDATRDDCWVGGRDPHTQQLYPDPKRFPHDLKTLPDGPTNLKIRKEL